MHITFKDTVENSLRSIAILGCNKYIQNTVANVTLPKAVLSTVKIFTVHTYEQQWHTGMLTTQLLSDDIIVAVPVVVYAG